MPDISKNPRYYGNNKVEPSNKKNDEETSKKNESSALDVCCISGLFLFIFLIFIIWFLSPYIFF